MRVRPAGHTSRASVRDDVRGDTFGAYWRRSIKLALFWVCAGRKRRGSSGHPDRNPQEPGNPPLCSTKVAFKLPFHALKRNGGDRKGLKKKKRPLARRQLASFSHVVVVSQLARIQTDSVAEKLKELYPDVRLEIGENQPFISTHSGSKAAAEARILDPI